MKKKICPKNENDLPFLPDFLHKIGAKKNWYKESNFLV